MKEKVLVLDVDETLLNMEPLFFLERFKKNYKEYEGKLIFDKYYLCPRPGVKEFIEKVKERFKLVAFSVVNREITREKLGAIGVLKGFFKIYGKEDLEDGRKSLGKIATDLKVSESKIVAIDDTPKFFLGEERDKVIKVEPWFIGGSKEDKCLLETFGKLELESTQVFS